MGNGFQYKVPKYQRDYSWEYTEHQELWQDILGVLEKEDNQEHYMGFLVFQKQGRSTTHFDIIDGQQRIATLSILILGILKLLKEFIDKGDRPEDNRTRMDSIRSTYIGTLDTVTLQSDTKITLNRNNDSFYKSYLVPLEEPPKRNLKKTEHLMRKASDFYYEQLKLLVANEKDKGKRLAQFLSLIVERLVFTGIYVDNELNAFKVFETLNSRGVKLSSTDLLKNYLFSIVDSHPDKKPRDIEHLDELWESISSTLGKDDLPEYLRSYWISRNQFIRKNELFSTIKRKIDSRSEVFDLVHELRKNAELFSSLSQPESPFWSNSSANLYLKEFRMFKVRQIYPLIMTAYSFFDEKEFTRLLNMLAIISFRYNVIGRKPPNEQEKLYNKIALKIAQGDFRTAEEAFKVASEIYPADEEFTASFAKKSLKTSNSRNKKITKYVLLSVEKGERKKAMPFMEDDSITVEHILPESPQDGWDTFDDRAYRENVYRIGNMTLLEDNLNREADNLPFNKKKPIYQRSGFSLTNYIADKSSSWNPAKVENRQNYLAKQASSIWKIQTN